jgi:phosphatidylglycerol lysyltransferase
VQDPSESDRLLEHAAGTGGEVYAPARLVWLHWVREHWREGLPIWLITLAVFASGCLDVLQVLLLRLAAPGRLFGVVLPFAVLHLRRSLTLALGFLLLYFSLRVLQRWRLAWWLAAAACGLSLLSHLLRWQLWYAGIAPAVTLSALLVYRRRFTVRSRAHSIARGLRFVGISFAVALTYGIIGFRLLDVRDFGVSFSLGDALLRTLRQLALLGNAELVPATGHARWFLDSLSLMGVMAGALAAYSLFRPVAYNLVSLPLERRAASELLRRYGRGSYDYFKVWADKSYFFSDNGRSFVSFRVAYGTALALGDPVGPGEELEETLRSFLRLCSDQGWLAAFLFPDQVPLYLTLGLTALKVGEEAIVDLQRFCSDTVKGKYFRYVRRKFEGEGYALQRSRPPHPATLVAEVSEVSDHWLAQPHYREMGFVQGRFEQGYVERTDLWVLRDPNGRAAAFVNQVPSYRPGEATFDMMRHLPGMHWGTMDFLFQGLMQALPSEGYRSFNLGLAPFAGVGERPGATMVERAMHQMSEHLGRLLRAKGLKQYKLKFEPEWQDRYLLYQGRPLSLAQIGLAISRLL